MSLSSALQDRCESKCELCSATSELKAHTVAPKTGEEVNHQIALCSTCLSQIENSDLIEVNHWRCLNESMWSPVPAVQVMCYRMLTALKNESWVEDLLSSIYMEEETREWAEQQSASAIVHMDSNGHVLQAGDTVTLIQDLNVKGANFTAKRGTAVRRIRLVHDNAEHIEGKVDGQQIVILTKFVKKTS